MNKKLTVKKHI